MLIEACQSGLEAIPTYAVGAITNVVAVEDIKMAIAEEVLQLRLEKRQRILCQYWLLQASIFGHG
ncbi:conserved hypothetical protein [Ricinus communis]|uniref:Uncharacterized protein n=1 Tax=Ricinus communis TaxID=3988 RepID=B9SKA6_RICCO|nr:conserved hypothetical protein [Ricinus communis]